MKESTLPVVAFIIWNFLVSACYAFPNKTNTIELSGMPPFTQEIGAQTRILNSPISLEGQVNYYWDPRAHQWNPLSPQLFSHNQWLIYGKLDLPSKKNISLKMITGITQSWDGVARINSIQGINGNLIGSTLGIIVGVSGMRSMGRLWMRSTPNVTLIISDTAPSTSMGPIDSLMKTLFLSGIPWFELGYQINPNIDLSLQTNLTPLRLTLHF